MAEDAAGLRPAGGRVEQQTSEKTVRVASVGKTTENPQRNKEKEIRRNHAGGYAEEASSSSRETSQ